MPNVSFDTSGQAVVSGGYFFMVGIYKITSPSKKVYIGQSVFIKKRFSDYRRMDCKNQKKLFASLKKYGVQNHKFEIIEECFIDELNDKERYYQDLYSSSGVNGLNILLTNSSSRKMQHSEETKIIIGLKGKGRIISEITRQKFRDRIISETTKIKMSLAKKGRKRTEEHQRKLNEAQKNRQPITEETRQRLIQSHIGKKFSHETKMKMSESQKNRHKLKNINNEHYTL